MARANLLGLLGLCKCECMFRGSLGSWALLHSHGRVQRCTQGWQSAEVHPGMAVQYLAQLWLCENSPHIPAG